MFKSVLFYTNKLKSLKRFYANVMALDITGSTSEQFTVNVGETDITFKQTETASFYHFAINIPGNQFVIMKHWIQDRLTLNKDGGINEIYYPSLDADSMYFEDPAGNLIELIGRRSRDLFGPLTKKAFFNVSEVGLITPYVMEVGDELQDFEIPLRHGAEVDPNALNYLGRDDTFIVLAQPAWKWRFSEKKAETHPLEITLKDDRHIVLDNDGMVALSAKEEQDKE